MPEFGVIAGSGIYTIPELEIIDSVKVSSPYGEPSDHYRIGRLAGREIAFLPRHGSLHHIPPHRINYRANIWGFRELGVKRILSVGAAGGISKEMKPGSLVLIDQIIDRHQGAPDLLIQVLLAIQSEYNWLPQAALRKVGEKLRVPLSQILHIATFYKAFSLVPKGRHKVHVCTGTACHVRGAPRILQAVQGITGIGAGETDLEFKFSLETVNCIGCCALGPVIEIDGKIHGNVSARDTADILEQYN